MATRTRIGLAGILVISFLVTESHGDFLIYHLGGGGGRGMGMSRGGRGMQSSGPGPMGNAGGGSSSGGLQIMMQGKIESKGGIVSFTHPTIKGSVNFDIQQLRDGEIEKIRAMSPKDEYRRVLGKAGKDPDALMAAAVWALKKGLLPDFYEGVRRVLDAKPDHAAALKVMELKKQMEEPLEENPATEKELRSIINRASMKIEMSKHFILLHDTPSKPEKGKRKTRAHERLDLLEKVYQSFLLLFHAQSVELDIPKERLKVVLFQDYNDFRDFADQISPSLASASGFWERIRNVSYFFDHGTTDTFKALQKMQGDLDVVMKDAKNAGDRNTINKVKVVNMLIEIERENADITVVSHEATHQMAGNTGLLPRHVAIPSWVHEGLATYFEAPGEASWAGIGAVNTERLTFYRALRDDRVHSNIDFIVGNQIFDYAGGRIGNLLHGYAQAWALTHFMLENHLKEFVDFYRMLGEMPPDVALNPDLLQELFSRVFGSDHKSLDNDWRSYMRTLKTDLERLEEPDAGKGK